jgi:hypothetical protein
MEFTLCNKLFYRSIYTQNVYYNIQYIKTKLEHQKFIYFND